jgi:hypothetical protein
MSLTIIDFVDALENKAKNVQAPDYNSLLSELLAVTKEQLKIHNFDDVYESLKCARAGIYFNIFEDMAIDVKLKNERWKVYDKAYMRVLYLMQLGEVIYINEGN